MYLSHIYDFNVSTSIVLIRIFHLLLNIKREIRNWISTPINFVLVSISNPLRYNNPLMIQWDKAYKTIKWIYPDKQSTSRSKLNGKFLPNFHQMNERKSTISLRLPPSLSPRLFLFLSQRNLRIKILFIFPFIFIRKFLWFSSEFSLYK